MGDTFAVWCYWGKVAVPKLLEMLALQGTIVTADALHCQRAIGAQIVGQDGDYALALKANQSAMYDDVKLFFDDPECEAIPGPSLVETGRGRIETRTATVSTDIGWLDKNWLHWRLDVVMNEGPGQNQTWPWPPQPRGASPHGSQRNAKRRLQRLASRKIQTSRMGRSLPHTTTRHLLKCDCPGGQLRTPSIVCDTWISPTHRINSFH